MTDRLLNLLMATVLLAFSIRLGAEERQLPLPEVPRWMTTPAQRADYVLCHFWDGMDWDDADWVNDTLLMEQNFVNFVSVFPHAADSSVVKAVDRLFAPLQSRKEAYGVMSKVAEMYLNDTESPMRDDVLYVAFLERFINDGVLDDARVVRYRYQLEEVSKNLPGKEAADFSYTDAGGSRYNLSDLWGAGHTVLMFYDPDCDHCRYAIGVLAESRLLTDMIADGRARVLAVDVSDEDGAATGLVIPASWVKATPVEPIEDSELYSFREMPAIYLLSPGNVVILKDASPDKLLEKLNDLRLKP